MAGVLALAVEASEIDPSIAEFAQRLARRLETERPKADELMTQEQAQLLFAANALLKNAGPVMVAVNGGQAGPVRGYEASPAALRGPVAFRNDGQGAVWRTVATTGAPVSPPPAAQNGLSISKRLFRLDGALADPAAITQGDRVVVVLSGEGQGQRLYPAAILDLLPAGLEIESILGPSDGEGEVRWDGRRMDGPFAWLGKIAPTRVAEKRDDRFVAALDVQGGPYTVAYVARAVTPGRYALPGAQIEDMYRPGVFGRSAPGALSVKGR
jgi:alpha-2-macroglobulin